jgi:hypothetical protein
VRHAPDYAQFGFDEYLEVLNQEFEAQIHSTQTGASIVEGLPFLHLVARLKSNLT